MNTPDPQLAQARYSLLCRALQAQPDASDPLHPLQGALDALEHLLQHELLTLARQASPDDFAELYLEFGRELTRFREFVAYPQLARKTIVAFGGAFSAGKSSLINSLIGQPLLCVNVDPSTALPTYVLAGPDAIYAINAQRQRIALSEPELASLTHDEAQHYGSQVARSLSAAYVLRSGFAWHNLAFIDTPGYSSHSGSGARTDSALAAAQLNSAHAIVWVLNLKQGVIPASDLEFLTRLDPRIPKLLVLSRADQIPPDERAAIVARCSATLAERNLPVLGVCALSALARHRATLEPLLAQLEQWNQSAQTPSFGRRFKALFVRYQHGLASERKLLQWQRNRIQRLLLLAENELLPLAQELAASNAEHNARLEGVNAQLVALRLRFFAALKRIGDQVGIALPEPHELDLLEPGRSNLLEQLQALRTQAEQPEPDAQSALAPLRQPEPAQPPHQALLLRRRPRQPAQALAALALPGSAPLLGQLLRRRPRPVQRSLALLCSSSP